MFDDNFAIVVYSHTDYKDVWPPMFASLNEYFPNVKKYFCVNQEDDDIDDKFNICLYNDELTYTQRVYHSLTNISEEVILFMHEDMYLYDEPDCEKISRIIELVEEKYSFIRLIKSEPGPDIKLEEPYLNLLTSDYTYKFAIQPTIWDVDSLLHLVGKYNENIWTFESKIQWDMNLKHMLAAFVYTDEAQRGMYHFDSKVYPYIATAIVKGKWNTLEYSKELKPILEKFNIDISKRGEYE